MVIARIRNQNRITIPQNVMDQKELAVGDEIYFEVIGKMGRDVHIQVSIPIIASGTVNRA